MKDTIRDAADTVTHAAGKLRDGAADAMRDAGEALQDRADKVAGSKPSDADLLAQKVSSARKSTIKKVTFAIGGTLAAVAVGLFAYRYFGGSVDNALETVAETAGE